MKYLKLVLIGLVLAKGFTQLATASDTPGRAEEGNVPKLVWAHYVGWGFNFAQHFDDTNDVRRKLGDRSLLPESKWVSADTGLTSTTRPQILSAMEYGVDGFTVDIIPTEAYPNGLGRLYTAAEGLPFYISLCVDGWPESLSVDLIVDRLTEYFENWGDHPNNFYIDGKPVIFIYKTSRSPESSAEIVNKLKARGHEAYWVVQPQRENTLWDNADLFARSLKVFDGLYDFGSNGLSLADMTLRLENGREALAKAGRPDGVLVAGITQGYNGTHNAYYRPFHGTGTLRDNWEAAMAVDADWVCLTTWNDYIENTHFEPSVWGRDALLKINREYARVWRGETAHPRPPQVFVAYKPEVRMGDGWTVEVQSFPYSTKPAQCYVRLLDISGNVEKVYPAVDLKPDGHTVVDHRFETPGLDGLSFYRVEAAITTDGKAPAADDKAWRELYPLIVRPGIMRDYQTLRVDLNELLPSPSLAVKEDGDSLKFTSRFKSWSWVGTAELLCNGQIMATQEIAKKGGHDVVVDFELAPRPQRQPIDVYIVRITRADGRYAWSNPVEVRHMDDVDFVSFPVVPRGGNFDETWGVGTHGAKVPVQYEVASEEIYGFSLPMDEDSARHPRDVGGWNIVSEGGGKRWGIDDTAVPAVKKGEGIPGGAASYYDFDGENDRIVVIARSLPHDVMTVEAYVCPESTEGMTYLLSDQNRALDMGIFDGSLFAVRNGTEVISEAKLPIGEWSAVAAVYTGESIEIYIDGKLAGQAPTTATIRAINSVPTIGCHHQEHLNFSRFYRGGMAGFTVTGNALNPDTFKLQDTY